MAFIFCFTNFSFPLRLLLLLIFQGGDGKSTRVVVQLLLCPALSNDSDANGAPRPGRHQNRFRCSSDACQKIGANGPLCQHAQLLQTFLLCMFFPYGHLFINRQLCACSLWFRFRSFIVVILACTFSVRPRLSSLRMNPVMLEHRLEQRTRSSDRLLQIQHPLTALQTAGLAFFVRLMLFQSLSVSHLLLALLIPDSGDCQKPSQS